MDNKKKETIQTGLAEAMPLAIAIAAYGLSYGVLATQANFSLIACIVMSMFVFSGSLQMVTVAMVSTGASLTSIVLAAILLNLRNLLYGAALSGGLGNSKKWRKLLAFGVSDEPFVLGTSRFKKYGPDPLYFGVVTAVFYCAWLLSSFLGALISNKVDPLKWGLDLAFPLTFVALLIPSLKGKPIIATALAAVIIAIGMESIVPGNELTIIVTGVLAPLVGLYINRRAEHV
ncbi:AzlC family ABC transporter permease [Cytobacillus sp. FJAT-53684]|uniref:AzlC family ABC transporter permease n=1 Tax=Cytobacillus mangrovibacter TaxID=3299024 RepID=A0ABW6JS93_9BACI